MTLIKPAGILAPRTAGVRSVSAFSGRKLFSSNKDHMLIADNLGFSREFGTIKTVCNGAEMIPSKYNDKVSIRKFLLNLIRRVNASAVSTVGTQVKVRSFIPPEVMSAVDFGRTEEFIILKEGDDELFAFLCAGTVLISPVMNEEAIYRAQDRNEYWPYALGSSMSRYVRIAKQVFGGNRRIVPLGPAVSYQRIEGFASRMVTVPEVLAPLNRVSMLYQEILSGLSGGGRILDAGCGTGVLSFMADAASGGKTEITGVDTDPVSVRVAIRNAERLGVSDRAGFYVSDMLKNEHAQGKYDIVLASLPLLENGKGDTLQMDFISKLPDLIKDGGCALAFLPLERNASRSRLRSTVLDGHSATKYEKECSRRGMRYERLKRVLFSLETDDFDAYCIYRISPK